MAEAMINTWRNKKQVWRAGGAGIAVATLVVSSLVAFRPAPDTQAPGKEVVLRLEPSENNPRNSEGDFIRLKNGRMLFIYSHFTGKSGSDFGHAVLMSRFSRNGGRTWSKKDRMVVPQEGAMNVMSVSLLRLQNGQIALFYARKNSDEDCIPLMRISNDEARTWSAPVTCITDRQGYFVLNNSRVIQLKSGRLLMPVAMHKERGGPAWSSRGKIYCYYSDDNGRHWTSSSEVSNPDKVITQEPGVVELKDGSVLMFIRTDAGVQYAARSKDGGMTWSAAGPTRLASPLSPASIKRIPSTGDLLAVWNNNDGSDPDIKGKRTPFNIAVSRDEGESWEHVGTVEGDPDGWYCYTAISFVDRHVLLGHCAGSRARHTGLAVTQITRLSLDWIYAQ